ncbi:hypothetical protein PDIP_24080 [Penicillium digitatum Pd1]|uniref:Uncharacterized protein n=1 Tax=Penicillium digitatum (strain Pd1 / CECT 20795) TaxID=1170230 RepID=K9GXT6_PEND1|nr:hypothetical protein PDIP_24080 [Penicillium digitatum Pd1]EKV19398.1 hypothetical protein PDIP_24080 [Penicillium digitatum Pd1]
MVITKSLPYRGPTRIRRDCLHYRSHARFSRSTERQVAR